MNGMQAVPILTYHSAFIDGNDYATNNHVALKEDLDMLDALGFRIVPLAWIVDALLDGRVLPDKAVAISMDDGTDFDFHDLPHPAHGMQRSMLNILRDFVAAHGKARQPTLHATTFVVASPQARTEMDTKCLIARDWYRESWWQPAQASGLMAIGNHSWDHNHPDVTHHLPRAETGTFRCIDTHELADFEIAQAATYIERLVPNSAASLFAYPYGESNAFLQAEYFASPVEVTKTRAAFAAEPKHVARGSDRWMLPRYVYGSDWRTPEDFRRILAAS
jgi:peptidoglycan/xylan/chitin deacetylase (PgdA/CDA1 family)